ncbi:MAG: D-alanine--D-alanine ligase [Bacteroidales bacterium]|nr:D-alanine--D-alanine ligase [Bacteroidales bacterium]
MKKNIAIIAGGDSSEFVVSVKSAEGLYSFIDRTKYNTYIVLMKKGEWIVKLPDGEESEIDKNDFSFVEGYTVKHFHFAYITIHGTPGEDGKLQGYFDLIGIPYSTCGTLTSALTFNKYVCNHYLKGFGVTVAPSIRLLTGRQIDARKIVNELGLPIFVKPNVGGSSFGVTKVKTEEELVPAIGKAFKEGNEVMIEKFMQGTEITCGCYKTKKKSVVFPITEVVSQNEFFDYDAKYNNQVKEITPARLPDVLTKKIQKLTSEIYDIIGAKGIIRIDYIISAGDIVNLLEINTTPGMTSTSFIPQQVAAAGLNISDVMSDIIENELLSTQS